MNQQLSNQEQQGQRKQDQEEQEYQNKEGEQGYHHPHRHPRRTGGVSHPFPQKLHSLLESQVHEDIISWQLDGMAFTIHKTQDFVAAVLPNVFNQTKLKSFQRQLSFYNFKRITSGPDAGAYRHPLFIRGMPHLCRNIIRDPFTKAAGATIRIARSTSNNSSGRHIGVSRIPPPTSLMQEERQQHQEEDDHDGDCYDHAILEKEQVWNSNAPNQRAPVLEPIPHDFFQRMERSPSSITHSNLLGFDRSSKLPTEQLLPNNNSVALLVEVSPLRRPLQHSNGPYFLCSTPAAPINNKNINDNNIRTKDAADTSTTFITKKRIDEAIREAVENVNDAIRKSLENFHSSLQTIANESFTASHSSCSKTTSSVADGTATDHRLDVGTGSATSTTMMSSSTTSSSSSINPSTDDNHNKSSFADHGLSDRNNNNNHKYTGNPSAYSSLDLHKFRKTDGGESIKSNQSYISEANVSLSELTVAGFMANNMDGGETSSKLSEGRTSAFNYLLDICSSEVSYNSTKIKAGEWKNAFASEFPLPESLNRARYYALRQDVPSVQTRTSPLKFSEASTPRANSSHNEYHYNRSHDHVVEDLHQPSRHYRKSSDKLKHTASYSYNASCSSKASIHSKCKFRRNTIRRRGP